MNDLSAEAKPALKASGAFYVETVKWVQHWTPSLFSFRSTNSLTSASRPRSECGAD